MATALGMHEAGEHKRKREGENPMEPHGKRHSAAGPSHLASGKHPADDLMDEGHAMMPPVPNANEVGHNGNAYGRISWIIERVLIENFTVSTPKPYNVETEVGNFQWFLRAARKNSGDLNISLYGYAPNSYRGNFSMEVEYQITILHPLGLAEKNFVGEKRKGKIYSGIHQNQLHFEPISLWKLVDYNLIHNGLLGVRVDFAIKSSHFEKVSH